MFVLAASDARSAYKELRAKMQLRLASHLIDGLVEDKNVMLMPALSPPARAGFAETRADIATGKCAPVHCTFLLVDTCFHGVVQVLLVHGARTCALMLCIDAGRTTCPEVALDMSCGGIHADRRLPCVLHVYS